jgi:hypothetical protein
MRNGDVHVYAPERDEQATVRHHLLYLLFATTNLMKLLTYFKIGILTSDVAVWVMANQVVKSGLKEAAVGAGPICDERRK